MIFVKEIKNIEHSDIDRDLLIHAFPQTFFINNSTYIEQELKIYRLDQIDNIFNTKLLKENTLMIKHEAIAEMRKGNKVTHIHFSSGEWMTMQGIMMILEDGIRCEQAEFWRWRTDDSGDDGYSLYVD